MSGFNFDPRTVKPDEGFKVIAGGQYKMVVYKTDMKPTSKDPTKWFLSVALKVVEGSENGHAFADNLNVINEPQTVEIAMARLSAYCHAVDKLQPVNIQPNAPDGMALPAIHNIPFLADVGVQGEYNRIKKVMPLSGPQMTAAPTQQFQPAGQPQPGANAWGAPPTAPVAAPVAPQPVAVAPVAPQPQAQPVLDANAKGWLAHIIAQNDAGAYPAIPAAVVATLPGLIQTNPQADASGNFAAAVTPAGRAAMGAGAPAPVVAAPVAAPAAPQPVPGMGFPQAAPVTPAATAFAPVAPVQQAPQSPAPQPNGGWQPTQTAPTAPPAAAPWAPQG